LSRQKPGRETLPLRVNKSTERELLTSSTRLDKMISTTDSWIADVPVSAGLKVVRLSDPDFGLSDDEIQDRNEFIRCYVFSEFELIMQIPAPEPGNDFFVGDYTTFDSDYSAFNTHDYHSSVPSFDRFGYAMKKILERVKDLAILHSCISGLEDRQEVLRRYEALVDFEFRDRLQALAGRYRLADADRRPALKSKISALNRRILQCKKVWERYAPWDV